MDKTLLISMFITFATSNDVLKYKPQDAPSTGLHDNKGTMATWPPKFCNDLDCPKFTVVNTTSAYEERIYEKANWVSTNLKGVDFNKAMSTMFMKLFGYIARGNKKGEKIAMTCPVIDRILPGQGPACESDFIMSFFMPGDTPAPTSADVYVESKSQLHVYVSQFGGFTPDFSSWRDHAVKLGEALDKAGLQYEKGYYYTAGYNAPFELFNRHNEIWFIKK